VIDAAPGVTFVPGFRAFAFSVGHAADDPGDQFETTDKRDIPCMGSKSLSACRSTIPS
jgi:hypothetical protein